MRVGSQSLQRPYARPGEISASTQRRSADRVIRPCRLSALHGKSSCLRFCSPLPGNWYRPRLEWRTVPPHGPHDSRHLVGQSNGRPIVASQPFDLESPGTQPIEVLAPFGRPENGARAVNEQGSEVDVAALADPPQQPHQSTGVLSRGQTEVAGEASRGRKPPYATHEGDQRRRGDQ